MHHGDAQHTKINAQHVDTLDTGQNSASNLRERPKVEEMGAETEDAHQNVAVVQADGKIGEARAETKRTMR